MQTSHGLAAGNIAPPWYLSMTHPWSAGDRARYEGTYDIVLPAGRVLPLRVFSDATGLLAKGESPGQGTFRLIYVGGDTFGSEFDASLRLTVLFEGKRPVKAQLQQRGVTMEGPRRSCAMRASARCCG